MTRPGLFAPEGSLPLANASNPAITSNSSSSMPLWRTRWNLPLRSSSSSPIFLSARCMAARRLTFSLARDSAHALNNDTKRYSRTSARMVSTSLPSTSGRFVVGQARSACSRRQVSSSGSSRWVTGS